MGLLRLVELPLHDVDAQWGDIPEPGTQFMYDDVLYECVMLNLTTVYAVPEPR